MKAIANITGDSYRTEIKAGEQLQHTLIADEPADQGGADAGPTAMGLLSAALGACTAATLRSYANLKGIPLEGVEVEVDAVRRKPSEQQAAGVTSDFIRLSVGIEDIQDIVDDLDNALTAGVACQG